MTQCCSVAVEYPIVHKAMFKLYIYIYINIYINIEVFSWVCVMDFLTATLQQVHLKRKIELILFYIITQYKTIYTEERRKL